MTISTERLEIINKGIAKAIEDYDNHVATLYSGMKIYPIENDPDNLHVGILFEDDKSYCTYDNHPSKIKLLIPVQKEIISYEEI